MKRKYRGPYSIKQALVQDYNWRKGDLAQLYGSIIRKFDVDLEETILDAIDQQIAREKARHELRLSMTQGDEIIGPGLVDNIHLAAVERVSRARAERLRDDLKIPT